LNKHKGLQQFFKWLMVDEEAIDRSPMERVRQPKTPQKLIPVIRDEDTKKLLDACKGKTLPNLRDEALIRLYYNTGARLSEVGNLLVDDVDMNTESVHFHGKGAKDRRVRFGPKTARALNRYVRARRTTGVRSCRTCGWLTGVGGRWRRTGSRSGSSGSAWRRGWRMCTRTGGGTTSRTSGSGPVATPVT
jgi:site-specific recombinase XerD